MNPYDPKPPKLPDPSASSAETNRLLAEGNLQRARSEMHGGMQQLFSGLSGLAVLGALYYYFIYLPSKAETSVLPTEPSLSKSAQAPTLPSKKEAIAKDLRVLPKSVGFKDGKLIGELKNSGERTYHDVSIRFTLADSKGRLVETALDYLSAELHPGQVWKFGAITTYEDRFTVKDVKIDAYADDLSPFD